MLLLLLLLLRKNFARLIGLATRSASKLKWIIYSIWIVYSLRCGAHVRVCSLNYLLVQNDRVSWSAIKSRHSGLNSILNYKYKLQPKLTEEKNTMRFRNGHGHILMVKTNWLNECIVLFVCRARIVINFFYLSVLRFSQKRVIFSGNTF